MNSQKTRENQRVLVTGAGRGIGRGIALEFAKQGASVVVHYSSTAAGANEVVDEILKLGGRAKAIQADMNQIDAIERLAAGALDFLGGIDVLVNNSGITLTEPFDSVTPRQFDEIYNVNIRAMFFLTQKLAGALERDGGGYVINITSIHAYSAMPEHAVYAGTKGAIVAYTRTLALELAKRRIRVNAIAPGWILIEKHHDAMPPGFDLEAAAALIPTGFIGLPQDAGKLCLFLSSDESRYIIGQTIMLDGGQSIVMPLAAQISDLFGGGPASKKR